MKKKLKVKQNRIIFWVGKGMFPSARKLAGALKLEVDEKVLLVNPDSRTFIPRNSDTNINWGSSKDYVFLGKNINNANAIAISVNKLKTFQTLQGKVNIPEWTTDIDVAKKWQKDKIAFLARHKLTGFGGAGIELIEPNVEGNVKNAPLYVQYKKKKKEFRVHVFNGEVIDVTQKKKRTDFEGEVNAKIRNYGNGWVYCREDIQIPDDLHEQAILAVRTVGLNFGAVDCIWNEKENKTYVLEINTAPGLEGTTIESYKNAILKEINPQVPPNDVRRNDQF